MIDNDDLARLVGVNSDGDLPGLAAAVIRRCTRSPVARTALRDAIERVGAEADVAVAAGARIIVLSDRDSDDVLAPIPSLLITSAVHQHLVRQKTRTKVGLAVEAGDVREVHHVALLLGYGAAAVNPYLALETAADLARQGVLGPNVSESKAVKNLVYAMSKGVLKVMSKMGISTVASYTGAQVFAAFGLDQDVLDEYFTGTCVADRRFRPRRHRRRRGAPARSWPTGPTTPPGSTAASRSAATTSGAARASCTCSTRRRCTCCSTPPGPSRRASSAATPTPWTGCPARAARCAGCSGSAPRSGPACRWRTSSRPRRS